MEKLKNICALLALLTSPQFYSQIVIGGNENETPTVEPIDSTLMDNSANNKLGTNSINFVFNRSSTFRTLVPSKGIFGDSIGDRANEKKVNYWSFALGFETKIKQGFYFGGGLSFVQNGEQFSMEQTDTAFAYVSTYRYMGMPLFLEYRYGKDLSITGTAGIMPAMFINYDQKVTTRDSKNNEETIKTTVKSGSADYNSFVLSGFLGLGLNYRYSDNWEVVLRPEYRFQLNNSYGDKSAYIHKASAFGVSFGLNYLLD